MSFDMAQLERRIAALEANRGASLRFGTVTEVDEEKGTARVKLEDGNGLSSWPLRVLKKRTLKDKQQVMPDVGEPVAVLFSGQGLEQGVVLGAYYSTQTPSPGRPVQVDFIQYEDGTEIWYDRKGHTLRLNVLGRLLVNVRDGISITCGGTISMDAAEILMQEGCEQ